ncbi:cyclin-D1-binding protein 1 homolog [Brienomyrus brachyistius]|uniref:cyclin-D1-binding protein 1 homolog n=1 Tax=Brienomyrus brachyistius TaxID=42636 RepID=UPI0020B28FB7|nr:cyclin-D1-binding protein 1 homolog [Brienomyrus brachyistius]
MSADNCSSDCRIPLRNLVNLVKCVRDRVKDGESNESHGDFNLPNFWETLAQATKSTSQEATKLSLVFSKPPLPSEQDAEKMAESFQKCILALSTVYMWFPKSQGMTLRRLIRDATVEVLEGVLQLIDVILSTPPQSLSQEQLTSTGNVWASCDQFANLPKDNRAAVLSLLTSHIAVVKDAIEEMEQAQTEALDPFSDVLDDEDLDSRGNRDTYWSESDRELMAPCQGLMKASAACLRKLTAAVKSNGNASSSESIAQLDDLADITKDISPSVDDLALSLYPPMDYCGVQQNACKVAGVLRKVLEIARASHVCLEADQSWVEFLGGAVDHNLQKVSALAQGCG